MSSQVGLDPSQTELAQAKVKSTQTQVELSELEPKSSRHQDIQSLAVLPASKRENRKRNRFTCFALCREVH